MILSVSLPRAGERMRRGVIHRLLARPGEPLRPGSPLLEVKVDLGEAQAQDCPPVYYFRLVSTERAHLRALHVAERAVVEVGADLGVATSTPGESADGAPGRPLRTTAILIQIDPLST